MNARHAALSLALMMAAGLSAPSAAQTTLTVSNWLPLDHPIVKDIVVPWGEAVEEATDGRVRVDVMSAPIGRPPAQYDLVADGAADVGFGVHGYTPNRFSLTTVVELPFLSDSAEQLSVAYQTVHEEFLAPADEHRGVRLLAVFTHGPGNIYTASDPVDDLADLNGRKLRVGGGLANEVARQLGVVPVSTPAPQVYEILSNGVADGILFPDESVAFFGLASVLDHGTAVPGGLFNTSFFMIMNARTWAQLSETDRAAIDQLSGTNLARRAGKAWDAADEAGRATMRAAGMTLTTADAEFVGAIRAELSGIEGAFIEAAEKAGIDGEAALARLRALAAQP